jgi:flagellar basal body rod protein FlgB
MMDGVSVTSPQHDVLLTWQPKMAPSSDGPQRLDGNRTTVEKEMSGMAMNAIKYQALTQIIQKQYATLKTIAQAK